LKPVVLKKTHVVMVQEAPQGRDPSTPAFAIMQQRPPLSRIFTQRQGEVNKRMVPGDVTLIV
jgi:hypothetical protein